MSFTLHSAAYPLDKEPDLFGQGFIDSSNEFFEEFLTFDAVDNEKSTYPFMNNSTDLVNPFDIDQSLTTPTILRDQSGTPTHRQEQIEAWELELTQKPSLSHYNNVNNLYLQTSRRASYSDSDLLSLGGISLDEPQLSELPLSPKIPSSPLAQATVRRRDRFVESVQKTLSIPKLRKSNSPIKQEDRQRSPIRKVTQSSPSRKVTLGSPTRKVTSTAGVSSTGDAIYSLEPHRLSPQKSPTRSPIRKITSPSKMMRATQYPDNNLSDWQSHMAHMAKLQAEAPGFDFGFANPQPLSPPPSARVSDASDNGAQMMSTSQSQHAAFAWDHPYPHYTTQQRSEEVQTPLATPTGHAFIPQIPQLPLETTYVPSLQPQQSWEQVEPAYNVFAPPQFSQEEDEEAPIWWSQTPMTQPVPTTYHRATFNDNKMIQLQNELVYNASELALSPSSMPQGLMIHMPHSPVHQPFAMSSPMAGPMHKGPQSYFPAAHQRPVSPRHRPVFPNATTMQSAAHQLPPNTVRKSRSHAALADSPSPTSRSASSFHVQKRRNVSQSRAQSVNRNRQKSEQYPGTPKTPKTPKGAGGFADFVNFTPSDSSRILTGVAPSGSSKTKARREKEAMEKRRRLSQAAIRAVQSAGGNIDSLVEEGLLM